MKTERVRRMVFCVLMAVAVLGAVAFMASVVIGDMYWRVVLQVAGVGSCLLATGALVLVIRRWAEADGDFWWPDSDT